MVNLLKLSFNFQGYGFRFVFAFLVSYKSVVNQVQTSKYCKDF